ncbi:hypothetical protein FQA39_LY06855 [Lamprigera yunnana]|nr:hypothetical protein FQA39_LY06855 [Lamprigera yunnana]
MSINQCDPEIANSWNKFSNLAKNAGYRDGAAIGREEAFQQSFDEGYTEGFKIGFALGHYKGVLQSHAFPNDKCLEETKRGLCEICKSSTLLDGTIEEVIRKQRGMCNNVLGELHKKYSHQIDVKLSSKVCD